MSRRVVSAREQVEMLSPWRMAAAPYVPPPHTELEKLTTIPEHGGRWHFPYQGGKEGGEYSSVVNHDWQMAPTDAPAVATDEFHGRPKTVYYDPTRTGVTKDDFRHQLTHQGNRIGDLNPPEGMLWRGMSDEEYQNALKNGHFESSGEYNIGGESQVGKTYFSTGHDHAESYANGFAPWQMKPTFTRPAHVIGIPDRPEIPRENGHEVGVSGRIPLSSVVYHYVGHPYAIFPGSYSGASNKYDGSWDEQYPPTRSLSPTSYLDWEDESRLLPHRQRTAGRLAAQWYHTSPYKMPVGTELTPGGGRSHYDPYYRALGEPDRKNHVWVEHRPDLLKRWHDIDADTNYHYRVEPVGGDPRPYRDGDYSQGWVVPRARIVEELGPAKRRRKGGLS